MSRLAWSDARTQRGIAAMVGLLGACTATGHAWAAHRLMPIVAERLQAGCFEWCALDAFSHAGQAVVATICLMGWAPWVTARLLRNRSLAAVAWVQVVVATCLSMALLLALSVRPASLWLGSLPALLAFLGLGIAWLVRPPY